MIISNRFLCPNCEVEKYYFDGQILKCPKCNQFDFESALHDSEGNQQYQELKKLKRPFFELDYGKIYCCDVECNGKVDKNSIIPIVSDSESNKYFIIFDVNYCKQYYPENLKLLMTKSFSELWYLEVKNKILTEYECPVVVGATKSNNSIITYNGWVFKNLVKVSEF